MPRAKTRRLTCGDCYWSPCQTTGPGLTVLNMNWQSFDAVPQRPKPRKYLSAWAWRGSSRWLKMPCASACQISTSASVIGLPSPSITWPRIRMRWPEVWSVVRLVSSSTSSPNEKNGPTVWLGVCFNMITSLLVLKRGHPASGQNDVEAEAQSPFRCGDVMRVVGDEPLPGFFVGDTVEDRV